MFICTQNIDIYIYSKRFKSQIYAELLHIIAICVRNVYNVQESILCNICPERSIAPTYLRELESL
jgi:hypothetical protein